MPVLVGARRWWRRSAPAMAALLVLACLGRAQPLELSGSYRSVHDPVIQEAEGRYYLFSTGPGIPIRCSDDLLSWRLCSAVFFGLPGWVCEAVPAVDALWAPDIARLDGRYLLYYAASSFGDNRSAIGLATNTALDPAHPDYAWQDRGLVIASTHDDDWNAIDPNLVIDADGEPWLAFGSFWSGVKLRKLDRATGLASEEDPTLYPLARRPAPGAVEAPFIVHHGGYYYLFVSFDQCCRGADSTYNLRVGRAERVTGPYLDREGRSMLEGGGTLLREGSERWRGPGHNAVVETERGTMLAYHAYDASFGGVATLRLEPITWDEEGWPRLEGEGTAAP